MIIFIRAQSPAATPTGFCSPVAIGSTTFHTLHSTIPDTGVLTTGNSHITATQPCFMASDEGAVATESPLTTNPSTAAPPSVFASASASASASALPRPRGSTPEPAAGDSHPLPSTSKKRPRDETPHSPTSPTSPTSPAAGHFTRDYSPTKVARLGLTAQLSTPLQFTGAAAVEEERRRREDEERRNPPGHSPNPNHKALSDLMSGGALAVSRPQDAPANMDEITLAAEATKVALGGPVTIPQPNVSDARTDISPPRSASSATGAADSHAVMNSPGPMDIDPRDDRQSYSSQPDAQMDDKTATSLSYPGILAPGSALPASVPPPRPSSLPHSGEHATSSSKKHKCPYCDTEFTRHHNLKSHLLTHSQEKPYLCQECKLRFRRLHDLKRHGKLHTGEKNHECPKCGRRFARGDALARHSKGAGGCAGRRASMGSYGDQGEYDGAPRNEGDDSSMVGVVYDGNGDVDVSEEDRRRLSLPAIKPHHIAGSAETAGPNSRTYPPAVGSRPGAPAVLYPPNVERGSNVPAPSSSLINNIAGGHLPNPLLSPPDSLHDCPAMVSDSGNSSLRLQGITESPKPLSPAVHDQSRQRSPGLPTQYQQQPPQYSRRPSEREIHPLPPLPPPHGTTHPHAFHVVHLPQAANPPQGQPPPGMATNAPAHSRTTNGSAGHHQSGDGSANLFAQGDQGVWAYIQQLEDRIKDLSERLTSLESVSNAREARLVSVESTLVQRDTKIGFLELEIAGLRKELADSRQHDDGAHPTS